MKNILTASTLVGAMLLGPSIAQGQCLSENLTQRLLDQSGHGARLLDVLQVPAGAPTRSAISIPVVVHVVWNTPEENVPDEQVHALIDRLNLDYSASNDDLSQVREAFQPVIGNAGISFCLARRDASGQATNGIVRVQTSATWFDPDNDTDKMKTAEFGSVAWAPDRYLNIWICDLTSGAPPNTQYYGYTYLPTPGNVGAWFDGVVLDHVQPLQPGDHTATHETGHYFGLLHPWHGGGCNSTDLVDDTPVTDTPTMSCTNPTLVKCSELTQYENFMDYGLCKCMFTQGQSERMTGVVNGLRASLLESDGCQPLPVASYCIPTTTQGTFDGDFIDGVVLNELANLSSGSEEGPDHTDYSDSLSATLAQGSTNYIRITGGSYFPDHYSAWIDFDRDSTFSVEERIASFVSEEAFGTVVVGFVVPLDAELGPTRLRVRAAYLGPSPGPVDPCAEYAYGESEDYGILIVAGTAAYCIPTSGAGTSDGDLIDGVVLGSITHVGSGSEGGPSYSDLVDTHSTELLIGQPATLAITGGSYAPDHYAAWIDLDQDLQFSDWEKLGEFTTSDPGETGTIDFTVPLNATAGATRMRVRGVYHSSGEPSPTDPCFPYHWGETEDYGIVLLADPAGTCVPTSTTGTQQGHFIDGIELADLAQLASGGGPAYVDHYNTGIAHLEEGTTRTLTVTIGPSTPVRVAAWLDRDQDGTFSSTELLGETEVAQAGGSAAFDITTPMGAVTDGMRLRVRCAAPGQEEPTPLTPCYAYHMGETEDYQVRTIPPDTALCIPTATQGPVDGDFIDGVVFADLQNIASGGPEGPAYSDHPDLVAHVVPGSSYDLMITSGGYFPNRVSAWIDLDQDNHFSEAERLGHVVTSTEFEEIVFPVTIPANTPTGTARLRVRSVYTFSSDPDPIDPCYAYAFGETEDYRVRIDQPTNVDQWARTDAFQVRQDTYLAMVQWNGTGRALMLRDAAGRTIRALQPAGSMATIALEGLAAGIYVVSMEVDGRPCSGRIVVTH